MAERAAEPLIPGREGVPRAERYAEEVDEVDESKMIRPGVFIWGLTGCAGVSGLLFGYECVYHLFHIALFFHSRNTETIYMHVILTKL